jgi:hypothetical protein
MSAGALPLPAAVASGIEGQDGIGEAIHQREVMEDAKDGAGASPGFLLEQGQHSPGQRSVQLRHRFVGQDELGLLDQGAGEGDPLLLAAREPADEPMPIRAKPEGIKATLGQGSFVGGKANERAPPGMAGERATENVLERSGVAGEVQLLEDQANTPAKIAGGMETAMLAAVGDRTGAVRVYAGEGLEQRRFAGAGRAHHRDKLAARNRDVEVADQNASAPLDHQSFDMKMRRVRGGTGDCAVCAQTLRELAALLCQGEGLLERAQVLGFVHLDEA